MPESASEKDCNTFGRKLIKSGTRREKYWPPGEGEHEITFALDLETLKLELYDGPREGADDWKAAFDPKKYLTGTIDWVHWGTAETLPWVDDLKTGHWPPNPKESRQLRSYLLVLWVKAGCPRKWKGVVSITQWEKYPLNGKPKRKAARLTALDMESHLQDLRYAVARPDEVNPTPDVYNEWGDVEEMSACTFCDCREEHPASSWMQHYKHRFMPMCWPAMQKTILGGA
jgi:hypothetical protein